MVFVVEFRQRIPQIQTTVALPVTMVTALFVARLAAVHVILFIASAPLQFIATPDPPVAVAVADPPPGFVKK
jgi:hypothetical protein